MCGENRINLLRMAGSQRLENVYGTEQQDRGER